MFRYDVELKSSGCDRGLLSYLAKCLREPSCTIIEDVYGLYLKEEEGYSLHSSEFETKTTTVEVEQRAIELLYILNGIVKLKFNVQGFMSAGVVYDMTHLGLTASFDDEGDGLILTNKAGIVITPEKSTNGRYRLRRLAQNFEDADKQYPNTVDVWRLVMKNEAVKNAIRYYYFASTDPGDRNKLYKIYETIEEDDKPIARLLPERLIKRIQAFVQSAHSAHLSSDQARHSFAGSKELSGATFMPWEEAVEFVNALLIAWLQDKWEKGCC